ncbi:hypothetical protein ACVWZX_000519 [Deinococcus sp. UYEF24]
MVNHTLRFRLGGMLIALGLILAVIEASSGDSGAGCCTGC